MVLGWLFNKRPQRPPTKAGLAYQRVEAALAPAFKLEVLSGSGGANNGWDVKDRHTGEHLFMFNIWGLKGTSSEPRHDDEADRVQAVATGLWTGRRQAERNEAAVKQAVAPFDFRLAGWESRGQDWEIVAEFELGLEPDTRELLDQLHQFSDACRRAYRILEKD